MTDWEKAVVMAYTGVCTLAGDKLCLFYRYVQDKLGLCVMTHELAYPEVQDAIKEASRDDFIELCKSSDEPRVMTLEEIGSVLKTPLWKETKRAHKDLYTGWVLAYEIQKGKGITGTRLGMSEPSGRVVWYRLDDYGKTWRCWTARPTDEQREAVKWDE